MTLGYIGLGKMGLAQVERLLEKGWRVVAWNRSAPPREAARRLGAVVGDTVAEVCERMTPPRLLWLMVSHVAVDNVLKELVPHLSKGDTVIDGGNSFYKDSIDRAVRLGGRRGIHFLDVGVSGGPVGARNGACLMVGGDKKVFEKCEKLFLDLSAASSVTIRQQEKHTDKPKNVGMLLGGRERGGYAYVGRSGAGHFVKMVHNGIEYGMMQSIAEGFNLLRSADSPRKAEDPEKQQAVNGAGGHGARRGKGSFGLNLKRVAELYNRGSVIESRLVGWLAKAYKEHGEGLKDISGEVAQSGEGLWTVKTAKELGVPVQIIKDSLDFRLMSKGNPSYTGQVVSALRNQFGGHEVKKK